MKVQLATTLSELTALEPRWNELAQGRPFVSPAWMAVWWRHFGNPSSPRGRAPELAVVSVVNHHGRVVATAPWYLEPSLLHGRTLRFLGSGAVCTEYPTIVCEPGCEAAAVAAIADWLSGTPELENSPTLPRSWDLLSLAGMDAKDLPMQLLCEALAARGAVVHDRPADRCWRLELPGDWEAYLAMLSKSHRKRVRRLDRAYFDTGRAQYKVVEHPDELEQGYRVLTDLHALRWTARGKSGVFSASTFHAFHREAMQQLLVRGELHLSWLELDGRAVAAEYSLTGNKILYGYQSGMDPAAAEHEPGSLSLIATIKTLIAEGYTAIDFLRGDEPYKQHWRAEPRPTRELRIVSDSWPCLLRHNLWQAATQAKDWLKKGRAAVKTCVSFSTGDALS